MYALDACFARCNVEKYYSRVSQDFLYQFKDMYYAILDSWFRVNN